MVSWEPGSHVIEIARFAYKNRTVPATSIIPSDLLSTICAVRHLYRYGKYGTLPRWLPIDSLLCIYFYMFAASSSVDLLPMT